MNFIKLILLLIFSFSVEAKLQNEDFSTVSEMEAKGLSNPQAKNAMLHDSKVYVTADGLNKLLSEAITDGDIGGGGSGSGEFSYITNGGAEDNTAGWTVYANTIAGVAPDNFGGIPSGGVTFTRNTTAPLFENADFKLSKDSFNRQGHGVYYQFTAYPGSLSKIHRVMAMLKTTSANYADDDLRVYLVSSSDNFVSNFKTIEASDPGLKAGVELLKSFQFDSSNTAYRLCIHVASTKASAYDVYLDEIKLKQQVVSTGAVVTDWQSYTPSFNNFGVVVTQSFEWKRDGDSISIRGRFVAPTPNAQFATFSLPFGWVTKLPQTVLKGRWWRETSSTSTRKSGPLRIANGVNTINFASDDYTSAVNPDNALLGTDILSAGQALNIEILDIPIQGWSSNLVLSEDSGNRLIAFRAALTGNQIIATTATTKVTFNTVSLAGFFDTTGSFSTVNNQFVAPESGYYYFSSNIELGSLTTNEQFFHYFVVNGSGVTRGLQSSNGSAAASTIADTFWLAKGDTVYVAVGTSADASYQITASSDRSNFSGHKISSPQTLAGSETVAMRAVNNSGQIINSGSGATMTGLTKKNDSHNALNATTGVYTVPMSGRYMSLSSCWTTVRTWSSTAYIYSQLRRVSNGSPSILTGPIFYPNNGSSVQGTAMFGFTSIELSKGDTLEWQLAATGSTTINASDSCEWSLVRVGN